LRGIEKIFRRLTKPITTAQDTRQGTIPRCPQTAIPLHWENSRGCKAKSAARMEVDLCETLLARSGKALLVRRTLRLPILGLFGSSVACSSW